MRLHLANYVRECDVMKHAWKEVLSRAMFGEQADDMKVEHHDVFSLAYMLLHWFMHGLRAWADEARQLLLSTILGE
eukprot:5813403-Pyramimonas_sp.AAC.2